MDSIIQNIFVFCFSGLLVGNIYADSNPGLSIHLANEILSYDRSVRINAINKLHKLDQNDLIMEQVINKVIQSLDNTYLTNSAINVNQRNIAIRDNYRMVDITKEFAKLKNKNAIQFVLKNTNRYFHGVTVKAGAIMINKYPVSQNKVNQYLINNDFLEVIDIINVIKYEKTIGGTYCASNFLYIIFEKLEKKGLTWKQSKEYVLSELKPYYDKNSKLLGIEQKDVMKKMIGLCEDQTLTKESSRSMPDVIFDLKKKLKSIKRNWIP
jgi:hypothetical protein